MRTLACLAHETRCHLPEWEYCANVWAFLLLYPFRVTNSLPTEVFCCLDGPAELSACWKLQLSSFEASRRSGTWLVETSVKGEGR